MTIIAIPMIIIINMEKLCIDTPEKQPADKFEEIDINLRQLARERRFGQIALTNNISPSGAHASTGQDMPAPNNTDETALARALLAAIAANSGSMKNILYATDMEFFIKLAATLKGTISNLDFPYFAADLYILLKSWAKEEFSTDLINGYYDIWLKSLWEKYA